MHRDPDTFPQQEILDGIRKVSGRAVPHDNGERRAGDPSILVAAIERATSELGWTPRESELETILKDAILWHEKHPKGFAD